MSVDCPFECTYLQESRERDRPPVLNPDDFPNQDIRITDNYLAEREHLLLLLTVTLTRTARAVPGLIDFDIREALESLIKTYRTLQSGLYYESMPGNPAAAAVHEGFQRGVAEFRERIAQAQGSHTIRDADILGILVFLQRLEFQHNNGRRRGRAFLHWLVTQFPQDSQQPAPGSSIISA